MVHLGEKLEQSHELIGVSEVHLRCWDLVYGASHSLAEHELQLDNGNQCKVREHWQQFFPNEIFYCSDI